LVEDATAAAVAAAGEFAGELGTAVAAPVARPGLAAAIEIKAMHVFQYLSRTYEIYRTKDISNIFLGNARASGKIEIEIDILQFLGYYSGDAEFQISGDALRKVRGVSAAFTFQNEIHR
jgi:hypothetical protein